jgi:hypothetical protein
LLPTTLPTESLLPNPHPAICLTTHIPRAHRWCCLLFPTTPSAPPRPTPLAQNRKTQNRTRPRVDQPTFRYPPLPPLKPHRWCCLLFPTTPSALHRTRPSPRLQGSCRRAPPCRPFSLLLILRPQPALRPVPPLCTPSLALSPRLQGSYRRAPTLPAHLFASSLAPPPSSHPGGAYTAMDRREHPPTPLPPTPAVCGQLSSCAATFTAFGLAPPTSTSSPY